MPFYLQCQLLSVARPLPYCPTYAFKQSENGIKEIWMIYEKYLNYGSMSICGILNMLWLNARKDFCMHLARSYNLAKVHIRFFYLTLLRPVKSLYIVADIVR